MTFSKPCMQSTVLGTLIVFTPAGMLSSSSFHTTMGCALRAVICAKADCTLRVERVSPDGDHGHVLVDERAGHASVRRRGYLGAEARRISDVEAEKGLRTDLQNAYSWFP
jgi:hypothetical protein